MKILVTGGAGFIGSHVVDTYVEAGHEIEPLYDAKINIMALFACCRCTANTVCNG